MFERCVGRSATRWFLCYGWVRLLTATRWFHQMETFSALLALCVGNPPIIGGSPHKGQWRGAMMFSLICTWTNGNRDAGGLRRHRAHYDVTVMTRPSVCQACLRGVAVYQRSDPTVGRAYEYHQSDGPHPGHGLVRVDGTNNGHPVPTLVVGIERDANAHVRYVSLGWCYITVTS